MNPAAELAGRLSKEYRTAVLPVDFAECINGIRKLMDSCRPDIVISLGLAPGRNRIEFERVAVNLADATIPDNAGTQPIDEPIVPAGPAAYFTTLPVKAMAAAAAAQDVPAGLSLSAGSYACNAVMYAALHHAASQPEPRPRCGFIHLPPATEIALADQERALRAALEVADGPDLRYAGGQIS